MKSHKSIITICIFLAILLSGCASKVTQDNFNKIRIGMSETQVNHILGTPQDATSISIGNHSGTLATWHHGESQITITFINNQVKFKAFTQIPQQTDPKSATK